jgi:hypothetical protein
MATLVRLMACGLLYGVSLTVQAIDYYAVASFGLSASEQNKEQQESLDPGGLYYVMLGGGVGLPLFPLNSVFQLKAEITMGMQQSRLENTAEKSDFTRFPMHVLPFLYYGDNHRLGFGISYHASPLKSQKMVQNNAIITTETAYADAIGWVLQYDLIGDNQSSIGMRVHSIDYAPDAGEKFTVESVGVHVSFYY